MFYEVLLEKRASRRRVNPPDLRLAQLYQDDDDLKRRIHRDSLVAGGTLGLAGGVPAAVLADNILKYDQKAGPRTRALSALGIPLGAAALGAYGASRLFPATDEYVKKLRVAQGSRVKAEQIKREHRKKYGLPEQGTDALTDDFTMNFRHRTGDPKEDYELYREKLRTLSPRDQKRFNQMYATRHGSVPTRQQMLADMKELELLERLALQKD